MPSTLLKPSPVMAAQDISDWFVQLASTKSLIEIAILVFCGFLAWSVLWLIKRNLQAVDNTSVLLGKRLVDGVLFPLLFLGFVYGARTAVRDMLIPHLLNAAIPVLMALVIIRMVVKVLQAAFKNSSIVRHLERTFSWLVWLVMVLWVSGLLPLIMQEMEQISWKIGGSKMTMRAMVEGTLAAGAVLLLTLWMSSYIEEKLLRHASGGELSLRKAASNAVRALLIFIGLLISLSLVGIDLTALSVLGGAIGVGIGFGLQKLAANYVSGFVILTERSMRIGDFVKIDNFEGRIADIKTRYTVVRSATGRESIVPNEMLLTNRVENLTYADSLIAQQTTVSVGYDSDVELVKRLLVESAIAQPRILSEPEPFAAMSAFGASGLDFILNYWIRDPENGQLILRSDLNIAILAALRKAKIDIPYPQQVVYMR